jgi:alpha-ketoglutarate-dependent taurine dioxygenase
MTQLQSSHPVLDITPVAGRIGAEVRGLRLSARLQGDTVRAQPGAAQTQGAVLSRPAASGRCRAGSLRQRLFDPVIAHPTVPWWTAPATSWDSTRQHGGRANSWHTDVTFAVAYPPKISVLRGVVIPPWGGDTVWANTAAAYQGLPPALKSWPTSSGPCTATITTTPLSARRKTISDEDATRTTARCSPANCIEAEHPVVRVHPETRERALVLGHFAKKLVG